MLNYSATWMINIDRSRDICYLVDKMDDKLHHNQTFKD
jgi:hypothetical protein